MKYFIGIFTLFLCVSAAIAQMAPPFMMGEGVFAKPFEVRCMNDDIFSNVLTSKKFHIAAMVEQEELTKVIFVNPDGVIIVANITKFGQSCVLDILENAYFSSEWGVLRKPHEEQN
jgi:hypothetical protein